MRAGAVTLGAPPGPSGAGPGLYGVVRDVAFRGHGYEHVVELAGRHRLTGIFHPQRHERGHNVTLSFDPAGCMVFSAADAGNAGLGSEPSGPAPAATPEAQLVEV